MVMLSYPVLENPVNMQAAQMLIKDEYMYRKIIRKLFQEPLKLKDDDMQLSQDQDKLVRSIKSISFNDYYKTWSRIATSKATESYRAPLLGDPHFIGEYYKWKKTDKGHPKEWKLKYAATKSHLARENKMLHQVHDSIEKPLWPTPDKVSTDSHAGDDDIDAESWENEVDDLVAWTNTLSVDNLEDET
ncbi:ubiquitin-conjugating enzyme E2 U isoform X4 [Marmota monax]|uniref:ubiquitin-conjugating enzyme E2 U isoform X5 n=1 Tax=Marmota monax TaxID=9995 RepID=UPI001EB0455B|nr:ubiquitin-conjugating enzyme E2 U isoform X5 [Marmota monax]XP_048671198.1 ubiquitin-conjugating enzyme E2 U isoform X5 [Marmota marmota marmota]XP_048671199.1 ubiquitin-conjugating enzyme E2 U isoform X5 [Marmota marmota marmota]XP_048671200.1 ubiquitin-conjugating enzyme E2 U isoform X6 [Marmota marmota marmota]XP_058437530.1 ubiquitin-conjugating enzyme E2 U isoform X4 [Marmota monax]